MKNDGDKEAEDVMCLLKVGGPVQEIKLSPEILGATNEIDKDGKVKVKVERLNPGETLTVAIQAGSSAEHIEIDVRGKGVNGEKESRGSSWWKYLAIVFGVCVGGVGGLLLRLLYALRVGEIAILTSKDQKGDGHLAQ